MNVGVYLGIMLNGAMFEKGCLLLPVVKSVFPAVRTLFKSRW